MKFDFAYFFNHCQMLQRLFWLFQCSRNWQWQCMVRALAHFLHQPTKLFSPTLLFGTPFILLFKKNTNYLCTLLLGSFLSNLIVGHLVLIYLPVSIKPDAWCFGIFWDLMHIWRNLLIIGYNPSLQLVLIKKKGENDIYLLAFLEF